MAGDAANVHSWSGADVYIATAATAGPADTTTAWPAGFTAVGLLDGEAGFTESRSEDTSEHYAWGGKLVRRTKSKHKRTFSFVALEDNDSVFSLVEPGSTRTTVTGTTTTAVKIPVRAQFAIGFELKDGAVTRRRWIETAEVEKVEDITENETSPTVYKITVVAFPEADGTLYHEIEG